MCQDSRITNSLDVLAPIAKCPYAKMYMLQKSPNAKCPSALHCSAGMFAMPKYYHIETSQSHNIPVPECPKSQNIFMPIHS